MFKNFLLFLVFIHLSFIAYSETQNDTSVINKHYVSEFSSIDQALTFIGNNEVALVIDEECSLINNITIPDNIALVFSRAGRITLNQYNLTIKSTLDCDLHMVFNCNSTGKVIFSTNITYIYPEWWGADGDDNYDDHIALNLAADTARFVEHGYQRPILKLSSSIYKINDSLYFSEINVQGTGRLNGAGSVILCKSSMQKDIIITHGNVVIEDLSLNGNKPNAVADFPGSQNGICIMNYDRVHSDGSIEKHPENLHRIKLENLEIVGVSKSGIIMENAAYVVIESVKVSVCGTNGLEISKDFNQDNYGSPKETTTVSVYGGSIFSDVKYYGIAIANGHSINISDAVLENTNGIAIGGTNRSINISNIYQEFGKSDGDNTNDFITIENYSSCLGFMMSGCFSMSSGLSTQSINMLKDTQNWQNVTWLSNYMPGTSGLTTTSKTYYIR